MKDSSSFLLSLDKLLKTSTDKIWPEILLLLSKIIRLFDSMKPFLIIWNHHKDKTLPHLLLFSRWMVLLSALHVQSSPFHICFVLQHSSTEDIARIQLQCEVFSYNNTTLTILTWWKTQPEQTDIKGPSVFWDILLWHILTLNGSFHCAIFYIFIITLPVSIDTIKTEVMQQQQCSTKKNPKKC